MIVVRFLIAYFAGLAVYMLAMVMTVYDGLMSMIVQPIAGAIIAHVIGEMTFYGTTEESAANTLKEVLRVQPDAGREGTGAGGQ